jgi:hypothetical protein
VPPLGRPSSSASLVPENRIGSQPYCSGAVRRGAVRLVDCPHRRDARVIGVAIETTQGPEPRQQCEQRDVVILRSMPGLGRVILAVLLAEVWQPLRQRDDQALRTLSGARRPKHLLEFTNEYGAGEYTHVGAVGMSNAFIYN